MTKKELIEAMHDMPDDYKICVYRPFKGTHPAGLYGITSVIKHEPIRHIELEVSKE